MITEDKLQKQVVAFFLDLEDSHGGFTFFSVPNEGKRLNGERYKAMGMRSGVHDLVFLLDGAKTVLIELKVAKKGLTGNQPKWHEKVAALGFRSIWFSSNDCEVIIKNILKVLKDEGFVYVPKTPLTMDQLAEKWVGGFPI